MSRSAIELLLYSMDRAFEGDPRAPVDWHSLAAHVRALQPKSWAYLPAGAKRSAFDIVAHLGEGQYVWDSQAFGDGSMHWDRPGSVPMVTIESSGEDVLGWLRESYRRRREHVAALEDDAELDRPRMTPQGATANTRWIISTMIEHDVYHAGELNVLRELCQGDA
ncbi:hypothetical protein AYO38_06515 [bacterium SCGC AG-212-C10]|nr:hypothetical protein AYO38_06515 [bacterium SCGC AG-212-C10]